MYTKKLTHSFITLTTALVAMVSMAATAHLRASTPKPPVPSLVMNYARPLSFEPNRGQADDQVDFLAHVPAYNLFLSHGDALVVFRTGATSIRMKPVGANHSAPAEALEQQPSKSNYFIGNIAGRWHTNIPNYGRVRYRNVYPGVDLAYYGNQSQLEYDFVVNPGADPHRILLQFQGDAKTDLDRQGNVVMHTAGGDLRWHKPIAYQEMNGSRKPVACAYARKARHRLLFELGAYDRTKPLIIDPVLEYSTYLGGRTFDGGGAIAVDSSGDAYVTGSTRSPDFPIKNAFQSSWHGSFNGGSNAFVAKFDVLGNLVYSTYLGGSGSPTPPFRGDQGNGIAVDAHGNAYITGFTASFDFPTKNAFQGQLGNRCTAEFCNAINAFVTKLDSAGNALVFSTFLGGTGYSFIGPNDEGKGIALDAHGNVYVTGSTLSFDFPLKNAFQTTPGGIFVTKFNAAGTALVYSTFLGVGDDSGNGIALDSSGNAYVTGQTGDPDFPTRNAFQQKRKGRNAFVTKFNGAGTALVYSTYLGGSGSDTGNAIAVDSGGNAYVTGVATSANFPLKNAFQGKLKSTNGNAFVTKFHSDGASVFYSTYLGGSGSAGDSGNSITVDSGGHPYVTGFTTSTDFPIIAAFQPKLGSTNGNAFVTKFHFDGVSLFYSSYLGGSGADSGNGIAVDTSGNAYVTGRTSSSDFPTKNAFQPMLGGPSAQNAFVTKISAQ